MIKGTIIAALRKVWLMSSNRSDALKKARIRRGVYKCNICHEEFKQKELQVHHVIPITQMEKWDWNIYINRLFDGEQIAICKKCHKNVHKEKNQKK